MVKYISSHSLRWCHPQWTSGRPVVSVTGSNGALWAAGGSGETQATIPDVRMWPVLDCLQLLHNAIRQYRIVREA